MGTKRLKMSRGVIADLLHKVRASPSCAAPCGDADDRLVKCNHVFYMEGGGRAVGVDSYITGHIRD